MKSLWTEGKGGSSIAISRKEMVKLIVRELPSMTLVCR